MLKLDFHIFKHLTNNTMKKLLLLLLIVPMVSFGQISNNYWEKLNEVNNSNNSNNSVLSATKTEISNLTAVDYFKRGMLKFNLKDYYGAIADYTKAIELNPDDSDLYKHRGSLKQILKDYNGAIADYTKAIELNNEGAYEQVASYLLHYERGNSKNDLKDYYGAIADYTKAIEVYSHIYVNASLEYPPFPSDAYYNRGISKENLGDLNGACKDWRKMKFLLEAQHLSIQKKCL